MCDAEQYADQPATMRKMLRPRTYLSPLLAASAVAFTATPSMAQISTFFGFLNSSQVVDATGNHTSTSSATGLVFLTMDRTNQTISADLAWQGLSGTVEYTHEHDAPAGVSRLVPPNNRFFHELIDFLDPTNPANVVGGAVDCGDGVIQCAPATGALHNFLDLTDGSYFDPTGAGAFTDYDALLSAVQSNDLFVDLHTAAFPGGEIRGQLYQIDPEETFRFYAHMDPSQVVGGSASTGSGDVTVTMDRSKQTIGADMSWQGLTGPADRSHIHSAPAGEPTNGEFFHEILNDMSVVGGKVACPDDYGASCAPATGETHDTLDLSDGSRFDPTGQYGFADYDSLLLALMTGDIYVDMHTEENPEGEIRGQLQLQADTVDATPEPSTILLAATGILPLAWLKRRRAPRGHCRA